jgi:hypothetical protein
MSDPLNLTLQTQVQSESRQDLDMALQGQMVVLRNSMLDARPRSVVIDVILFDCLSSVLERAYVGMACGVVRP